MRTNPLAHWRVQASLTQAQLAKKANVTIGYVTRAEAGMFNSAPTKLIEALSKISVPGTYRERFQVNLLADYRSWVLEVRSANKILFKKIPSGLTLKQLIKHFGTKYALCKLLCVQASLLDFALKNNGSSLILSDALFEVGYELKR